MEQLPTHIGADYGSKMAGTTAIAFVKEGQLHVSQSIKAQDADSWLLEQTKRLQPKLILIDAPLSLPRVYTQVPALPTNDFFYRTCDRELQAMSPMFIGGLTARAIKLRTTLAEEGIGLLETYPSQLARLLFGHLSGYKKTQHPLQEYTAQLQKLLPAPVATPPRNWHQFDALLAWYSGYRHSQKQSVLYGDATEGRIIV